MRSFNNLTIAVNYAEIDDDLFNILSNNENRFILLNFLLDEYFPKTKQNYHNADDLFNGIASELSDLKSESYRQKLLKYKEKMDDDLFQEEVFVRSGIFKREIVKIYNNTCCISGLCIDATINATMVDACHIVPFSESFDDTLVNGIALCPNLHRAFDRGFLSIDSQFKVLVNDNFTEKSNSAYGLRQFKGSSISLPSNNRYFPSQKNLELHRVRFNF